MWSSQFSIARSFFDKSITNVYGGYLEVKQRENFLTPMSGTRGLGDSTGLRLRAFHHTPPLWLSLLHSRQWLGFV
jgi:hypothetical protein